MQETPGPAGLTHKGFIRRLAASLTQPVMLGRGAEEEEEEGSNNLILGAVRRESKPTARWFNITGLLPDPNTRAHLGGKSKESRECAIPCPLPCQGKDPLSPGLRAASWEGRGETRAPGGT